MKKVGGSSILVAAMLSLILTIELRKEHNTRDYIISEDEEHLLLEAALRDGNSYISGSSSN